MEKASAGHNSKEEKLLLDKTPTEPPEVPKVFEPPELPKQVNKAKLNTIGFNAPEERTGEVLKLLDKA